MKVLIVAAHPDDEVLGCGGTILAHKKAGHDVKTLFLSEGVSSRGSLDECANWGDEIVEREEMAAAAARILGTKIVGFLRMKNLRMRDEPLLDLVKLLIEYVDDICPDIVYTHHPGDLNTDHRVTYEAVYSACRPQDNFSVMCLRVFEVPSSTDWASNMHLPTFQPDTFVDIKEFLDRKIQVMAILLIQK